MKSTKVGSTVLNFVGCKKMKGLRKQKQNLPRKIFKFLDLLQSLFNGNSFFFSFSPLCLTFFLIVTNSTKAIHTTHINIHVNEYSEDKFDGHV